MAYMCADSGNLMAIAQQVIQQQQQRQQQQHTTASLTASSTGAPPWGSHFHPGVSDAHFPFAIQESMFGDSFVAGDEDLRLADEGGLFRISDFRCDSNSAAAAAAEFESDEWMESLIGDSPTESETWHRTTDLPHLYSDTGGFVSSTATVTVPFAKQISSPVPLPRPTFIPTPHTNPPLPEPNKPTNAIQQKHPATPPLLKSLAECAVISDASPDLALKSLDNIISSASDLGTPTQRVSFYFADALRRRISPKTAPGLTDYTKEEATLVYKELNEACPYSKFAHLTANQAILEAMETASHIHIVDFGIGQGVQWAALLQALATRSSGKPELVRISGIPSPFTSSSLAVTGRRLSEFAELLDLNFEFNSVLVPVTELSESDLGIDAKFSLAVNFMFQLHQLLDDEADSVERLLRLFKSVHPRIVTLGEYELSMNQAGFADRFGSALTYYAAMFDSLEPAMGRDSAERRRVEKVLLGDRICKSVGLNQRLRMEDGDTWRGIMERCGFESVGPSHYAVSQAKLLLWNYDYSPKYELIDTPPGLLSVAWEGRPLVTVSSWR